MFNMWYFNRGTHLLGEFLTMDHVYPGLGDAGAQARQVYRNIGRCLAAVGATPQDVVKIHTILVDRADRDAVTAERLAFFGAHRPPHTGIIVVGLGSPEVRVEVEVVAWLPQR